MRKSTWPALLVAACLLPAPRIANAQDAPAIPAQPVQAPTAKADPQATPLAWSAMSTQQQRMLAPLQDQWSRMHPARQHRLAERAQHWANLPPPRQQQIRERLTRWARMTPAQRRQLRENARAFHRLTPQERTRVSEAFRKFQSLPPAQRRALRERWRAMSPQQRMHWTEQRSESPPPSHPTASVRH